MIGYPYPGVLRALAYGADNAVQLGVAAVRGWVRWFWHLSIGGKVAATVGEVILLQLLVGYVPTGAAERHAIVEAGGLALAGFLLAGILFGPTRSAVR